MQRSRTLPISLQSQQSTQQRACRHTVQTSQPPRHYTKLDTPSSRKNTRRNQICLRCKSGVNEAQPVTPLLDAVKQRGQAGHDVPLHIPGHKRGSSVLLAFRELMSDALKHDLTELPGVDTPACNAFQQSLQLSML